MRRNGNRNVVNAGKMIVSATTVVSRAFACAVTNYSFSKKRGESLPCMSAGKLALKYTFMDI